MSELEIRPLEEGDIGAVARMQHHGWHDYYAQYSFYPIVRRSVTVTGLESEWREFLRAGSGTGAGPLIVGRERQAYVAVEGSRICGVAAVSSYVEGKWPPVDALLRQPDGHLRPTAKFQELYITPDLRGAGIGHYLTIARADWALARGYEAIFLTTFGGATKTITFHQKNGLKLVHEYQSMQQYEGGLRVPIVCFLDLDLAAFRARMAGALEEKLRSGRGRAAEVRLQ